MPSPIDGLGFQIISETEVERLEKTAHNPPLYNEVFTPGEFDREYWSVWEGLKSRAEIFGEQWEIDTNQGDFMLPETRGESRWIYLTFISTRLWRPEFVAAVAEFLGTLKQDYRVGCVTELNDKEFLDHPLVYLVISSTKVLGNAKQGVFGVDGVTWKDCPAYLQRFGFALGADSPST